MRSLDYFDIIKMQPRQGQIEALRQINDDLVDMKYFVLSAPTGVGKSLIGLAAAHQIGSTFVLTSEKQLQDQYGDGPGGVAVLKGRSNYECAFEDGFNCENAPCRLSKWHMRMCKASGTSCPYIEARTEALNSKIVVMNYAYFLYAQHCGPFSKEPYNFRSLMVLDEAHSVENHLVNFVETDVNLDELRERFGMKALNVLHFYGDAKRDAEAIVALKKQIKMRLGYYVQKQNEILQKAGIPIGDSVEGDVEVNIPPHVGEAVMKQLKPYAMKHSQLDKYYQRLIIYIETREKTEWVVHAKTPKDIMLSPLYAKHLFMRCMSKNADKFLFMSATIGTRQSFINELGLPQVTTKYIDIGCEFDPKRSPIKLLNTGKFNMREIDKTLPHAVRAIDKIASGHPNHKGVVHTTTYKIAEAIQNGITPQNRRRLITRDFVAGRERDARVRNDRMLAEHLVTKHPSVLVSPSMHTGVSLDDDLSRWQIVVKMPFKFLGDPRIKRKADIDNEWFVNQMFIDLMQACGRSTRSAEDFSITYILDSSLTWFINQNRSQLPQWFLERIVA